jgi:uncharacterized protein (TIGR03435 family)
MALGFQAAYNGVKMLRRCATVGCLLLAGGAFAQEPRPSFEVASVKAAAPLGPFERTGPGSTPATGPGTADPSRFRFRRVPLAVIIGKAYGLRGYQISGPSWLAGTGAGASLYDVEAKIPTGASADDVNPMLQGLLEERFNLKFHRETREVAGWELVVGKSGFKLKESSLTPEAAFRSGKMMMGGPIPGGNRVRGAGNIAGLVFMLERWLDGTPVIDKTGLSGNYEFDFEFAPTTNPGQQEVTLPSLWTALQQDVGLQLVRQKLQIEVMAIDHVDKAPTEN